MRFAGPDKYLPSDRLCIALIALDGRRVGRGEGGSAKEVEEEARRRDLPPTPSRNQRPHAPHPRRMAGGRAPQVQLED
jgi:hypothetical protein